MNEKTCANCGSNTAGACYSGLSDYWMEKVPGTACAAWKPYAEVQNYMRRVKRYAAKAGLGAVKYIIVTEKGSKKGRIHHHAVIEFEGKPDRDKLESLWTDWPGHGFVRQSHLQFNEEGLEGLARYTSKSPIGKKAWMASRNLVDPEPKIRDGRVSGRKAKDMQENPNSAEFERLYPGYKLAKAETFHNEVNGGHYICLRISRSTVDLALKKAQEKQIGGPKALGLPGAGSYLYPMLVRFGVISG